MPKEQINHPAPDATLNDATALSIHWNSTGKWVQASMSLDRRYLELWLNEEDDNKVAYFTPVLTSEEIDKLIKTLKRAKRALTGNPKDADSPEANYGPIVASVYVPGNKH